MESLIFPLLIALLAIPLFLQGRKQKKAMQAQQKLQNSLTEGDRVMTTSGLFGTVVGSEDDSIDLEIAPGVVTTWVRAAVREKVNTESAEESSEQEAEEPTPDEGGATKAEVAAPIEQQQKTN